MEIQTAPNLWCPLERKVIIHSTHLFWHQAPFPLWRSQQETKEKSLAYRLCIVAHGDEQNTGFTAVVSIIEKVGDSKCFRMCNFRARCHLRIYNNTASIVVFLSISQTGITLDTGKVWPGNSIWLIVLTSELPAMNCHIGDLNFLLTKTPDPQVHKEPNVIRPG